MGNARVVVLGAFVADLAFMAARLPLVGETVPSQGFAIGPGGKGSNQAIASARAGAPTAMITKIGNDTFGKLACDTWMADSVDISHVTVAPEASTGAAFIFVSTASGDNAIIVESGAAACLSPADLISAIPLIAGAEVFVTQYEQPIGAAMEGLRLARAHGVTTILNPAPAMPTDEAMYGLCDYVTPNESEAAVLTGIDTSTDDGVLRAAERLREFGAREALITLGARGALLHGECGSHFVPAFPVAKVVDTAGAGDAFNGGFAAALAEGRRPLEAVRFAMAVGGLSVQRRGTAPAMPHRYEIEAFLHEHA